LHRALADAQRLGRLPLRTVLSKNRRSQQRRKRRFPLGETVAIVLVLTRQVPRELPTDPADRVYQQRLDVYLPQTRGGRELQAFWGGVSDASSTYPATSPAASTTTNGMLFDVDGERRTQRLYPASCPPPNTCGAARRAESSPPDIAACEPA
jgi:hypothetical protein